ncbi:hypothetical protein V5O48_019169, partial [Marasmius crinis-equi]
SNPFLHRSRTSPIHLFISSTSLRRLSSVEAYRSIWWVPPTRNLTSGSRRISRKRSYIRKRRSIR